MTIKGRKGVSREGTVKVQEKANKEVMTVRRVRTGALIIANVLVPPLALLLLLRAASVVFMSPGELFTTEMNPVPRQPIRDNYRQALVKTPLARFVCNSFTTVRPITARQIISCPLTAFSSPFLELKGKNALFMPVMVTMMISGETTIISNYPTVSRWNWLDPYQVLIVPYLTSAMGISLLRQFYKSFPISLYESARTDGCGSLRFISRILLPLTKSAIGAMAVYIFINAWNMYMWLLLVAGSNEIRIVQTGIGMLNNVDTQSITLMTAGVIMIILSPISIFILGQKQLIRGMFSGTVKGQEHPGRDYGSK